MVYPPLHDVEELEILQLGRKRFKIKVKHQQWLLKPCSEVVVSNIFYFDPCLGKWSNLTNIIEMGWNHQLDVGWFNINISFALSFKPGLWGKTPNSATGNCSAELILEDRSKYLIWPGTVMVDTYQRTRHGIDKTNVGLKCFGIFFRSRIYIGRHVLFIAIGILIR